MSDLRSQIIALEWLRGVSDFVGSTLSETVTIVAQPVESLAADGLEGLLERCPLAILGEPASGGMLAMLLPETVGARIADLSGAEGSPDDPAIDDNRLAFLNDLAGMMMAGGAGALSEALGQEVEIVTGSAALLNASDADQIAARFGPMDSAAFTWTFESGLAEEGMLVYSASINDVLGASAAVGSAARGSKGETLVSDEEMKDILRGFGPEPDAARGGFHSDSENLHVILDIELIATARLGRVEMPIAEILTLGPGSIIEVGKLVDEPIELLVNNKLVARGDVVVVDEKFGLRITEIISPKERIESLR